MAQPRVDAMIKSIKEMKTRVSSLGVLYAEPTAGFDASMLLRHIQDFASILTCLWVRAP